MSASGNLLKRYNVSASLDSVHWSPPSTSVSNDAAELLLNGHAREKRPLEGAESMASHLGPPLKKSCLRKEIAVLDFEALCERKRQLGVIVRRRQLSEFFLCFPSSFEDFSPRAGRWFF